MDTKLDFMRGLISSRQFAEFLAGTKVTLPTGEKLQIEIESVRRFAKPHGFRFHKYCYTTRVKANGLKAVGCGESDYELLAIEKSIAESAERIIFKALKGTSYGTATSNGWATHISSEKCKSAALMELLERDAALTQWLAKKPMEEIILETLPPALQDWQKFELPMSLLPNLRVLVSTLGHVPLVSTFLLNSDGYGVVSHSSSKHLGSAISKALAESCRLAYMASQKLYFDSSEKLIQNDSLFSFGPGHHAVAYTYHNKFPDWIFGNSISLNEANTKWVKSLSSFRRMKFQYDFNEMISSPLSVGFCKSKMVQNLFFGTTPSADRRNLRTKKDWMMQRKLPLRKKQMVF